MYYIYVYATYRDDLILTNYKVGKPGSNPTRTSIFAYTLILLEELCTCNIKPSSYKTALVLN